MSQISVQIDNHAETEDESKKATGYLKMALNHPKDNFVRPIKSSQLMGHCELNDDMQMTIQQYAPTDSIAPAESNSHHIPLLIYNHLFQKARQAQINPTSSGLQ